MGCPSNVVIGDNLVFSVCTHDPDTGALTDADAAPVYRVYEDEDPVPILTGILAKLDDLNTVGFYTESIACTALAGFEEGKSYTIYVKATVDDDPGGITFAFKCEPLTSFAAAVWNILTSALTTAGSAGIYFLAQLAKIVSGTTITITSPVTVGGDVTTIQGDTYELNDGRSLDWTSALWPDLTSATISVVVRGVTAFAGSVVTPTGTAVVRLELTAVQSATIPADKRAYMVYATQTDGDIICLVSAWWTSKARVSAT